MRKTTERIYGRGERSYSLIDHSITHHQFLYRQFGEDAKNHDILFAGVAYFSLPIYLNDFIIRPATVDELEDLKPKFKRSRWMRRAFIIEEGTFRHFIVANDVAEQWNDYEALETSIDMNREENQMSMEELHRMMEELQAGTYVPPTSKYEWIFLK